jgi:hypothetical protein
LKVIVLITYSPSSVRDFTFVAVWWLVFGVSASEGGGEGEWSDTSDMKDFREARLDSSLAFPSGFSASLNFRASADFGFTSFVCFFKESVLFLPIGGDERPPITEFERLRKVSDLKKRVGLSFSAAGSLRGV